MDTTKARSSRRRFLRQIGVTLGVAAGAALYPALAHAATNCCPANGRCGTSGCISPNNWYWCECGPGSDYCICKNLSGGCYNGPC